MLDHYIFLMTSRRPRSRPAQAVVDALPNVLLQLILAFADVPTVSQVARLSRLFWQLVRGTAIHRLDLSRHPRIPPFALSVRLFHCVPTELHKRAMWVILFFFSFFNHVYTFAVPLSHTVPSFVTLLLASHPPPLSPSPCPVRHCRSNGWLGVAHAVVLCC